MVLEVKGNVQPSFLVDALGNPAVVALSGGVYRLFVDALLSGGGGTPDVRNADADADFAKALLGLEANARLGVLDEAGDEYTRLQGLKANGIQAAYALAPRADGYAAVSRGRRFFTTHQTPGTGVTAQTSFVATTPTFLLNNAAATRAAILRAIIISQSGIVAGGNVNYSVAIDSANRYSSGGTAVVPQNGNADSAVASAVTAFRFNPTATAAGAGTRYVAEAVVPASLGTLTSFLFADGLFVGTTGSILFYAFAAVVAPTLRFVFEWEEVVA
jgi:hypothetical protein